MAERLYPSLIHAWLCGGLRWILQLGQDHHLRLRLSSESPSAEPSAEPTASEPAASEPTSQPSAKPASPQPTATAPSELGFSSYLHPILTVPGVLKH